MVDLQGQAVVAVLTRAPSTGGKSRLFAALGRAPDPRLLRALFLDTLDAAAAPGVTRVACFTPASAEVELAALVPAGVALVAQRGDDLGARMRSAFDDLFAAGARAVVLVGSDLPALDTAVVVEAHASLRERPEAVAIAPATDGGYSLIGATRTPAALLDGVVWGGPDVYAHTKARARTHNISIHELAGTFDIDGPADLQRLAASAASAPRTREWMRHHR